jgi:hypothetical protein
MFGLLKKLAACTKKLALMVAFSGEAHVALLIGHLIGGDSLLSVFGYQQRIYFQLHLKILTLQIFMHI